MKSIWKFVLNPDGIVNIPADSKILTVQVQHEKVCLWALVETRNIKETRQFHIYGTGHIIEGSPGEYIGTFQLHGGALVFHVFEEVL